jgi:hypothetical protein
MALVDPNIALSYRGLQLQDPLDQYSKASAAQLNALKMDEIMRERDALSQIQSSITAKGGPPDLRVAAEAMFNTGRPEFVKTAISIFEKLNNQKRYEDYLRQTEGAPSPAPAPTPTAAPVNALAPSAAAAPTPAPVNALAAPVATSAPLISDLERRYKIVSGIDTPEAKAEARLLLKRIDDAMASQRAENASPDDIRTLRLLGLPVTVESLRQLNEAKRAPQQPAPLVPVLKNGQPTLVPREQAVGQTPFSPAAVQVLGLGPGRETKEQRVPQPPSGYRFTPSGDLEPIPGGPAAPGLSNKDIQKREAVFPQATQAVKGFETKSDLFIKDLERLRDDPGLNQITGPIYGRTPSVSQAGSRAQALYNKIFAKGGFQALQDMREASKTGGALGNVSNEEGRRLERSIVGGLDRTQNIKDVKKGIDDLIDEIRTSKSRVREAYDSTYEYRTQQGAAPAQPASTGGWSVVR